MVLEDVSKRVPVYALTNVLMQDLTPDLRDPGFADLDLTPDLDPGFVPCDPGFVPKEKATPVCRRCAVPCVARLVRRLRNSRYALRQSSPKSPDQPALLGGAQGNGRYAKCASQ
jgi:hypothetical protein